MVALYYSFSDVVMCNLLILIGFISLLFLACGLHFFIPLSILAAFSLRHFCEIFPHLTHHSIFIIQELSFPAYPIIPQIFS